LVNSELKLFLKKTTTKNNCSASKSFKD